jgi:P27 family predicted phage terminase small subunit
MAFGKPDERKKLTGTFQNCRARTNAPTPEQGAPPKPEDLNEEESREWDYITSLLAGMKVLTEADGHSLEAAIKCYQRLKDVRRQIDALGGSLTYTIEHKDGTVTHKMRPEAVLERQLDKDWCRWLARLGMTPVDHRTRLVANKGGGQNPFGAI